MNRYRPLLLALCAAQLIFAALFLIQSPFALGLWPFPDTTPMTYILLASFFAAAGISTGWAVLAKEAGALAGIGLDYVMIFAPLAVLSLQLASALGTIQFGMACAVGAIFGVWLLLTSQRIPMRNTRPMPKLVYGSFVAFIIALALAGGALVLKVPNILPWTLTPDLSVVCGWMFLGAAAYFAYGLMRPSWHNAVGQLAGFLAYDLVLIVPFLQRLPTIAPEYRISLYIYIVVVIYSGLLAIYYLFVNRSTRIWGS